MIILGFTSFFFLVVGGSLWMGVPPVCSIIKSFLSFLVYSLLTHLTPIIAFWGEHALEINFWSLACLKSPLLYVLNLELFDGLIYLKLEIFFRILKMLPSFSFSLLFLKPYLLVPFFMDVFIFPSWACRVFVLVYRVLKSRGDYVPWWEGSIVLGPWWPF